MVSRSSAEAEYRSIACELIWLQILMKDLRLLDSLPMKLYCDNKAAMILFIILFNMTELNILRLVDIS